MNFHQLAGRYQHLSFPRFAGFLATSLQEVVHTISLFGKKAPTDETIALKENPDSDWLQEFESEASELEISELTAGKSAEELSVARKEVLFALQRNQIDLAEIICEISRSTQSRSLDLQTKAVLMCDFDVRFNRLMQEMESNETTLAAYNAAISKFFARRRSDNMKPEQSVHV